ncbi:MAG TPA: trypsin-like peptidase domain-containing protein [Candidatus Limnocylindrales bacterium]|nr:trypsin-like peptidase domain-containing protein [Candidatus Limnocylindrales bacterium]
MTSQPGEPPLPVRHSWSRWADRLRPPVRRAAPFVLGVVAVLVALAVYGRLAPAPRPLDRSDVEQAIASALASATARPAFSEQAYEAVRPALVLIQTTGMTAPRTGPRASPGTTSGLGSGVVIDDQGEILTSLHVVAGATAITVTFADGSQTTARVTTSEADKDIAVLQPAQVPSTVMPATLGNPASLQVGSEAYAVGNPFGLSGSMSAGIVSGLDRSFQEPGTNVTLEGLIQIDAAVNPGNSGGPLVDRDGRVLGIVTGLINPTDQDVFIGIGFAVPIDVAGGAAGLPQY